MNNFAYTTEIALPLVACKQRSIWGDDTFYPFQRNMFRAWTDRGFMASELNIVVTFTLCFREYYNSILWTHLRALYILPYVAVFTILLCISKFTISYVFSRLHSLYLVSEVAIFQVYFRGWNPSIYLQRLKSSYICISKFTNILRFQRLLFRIARAE